MAKRMAFPALLALLLMTSAAEAQEPVDVSRLPINLERIQRELRQASIRDESEGLNIRYIVDVYGQAPPIVIFGPAVRSSLRSGAEQRAHAQGDDRARHAPGIPCARRRPQRAVSLARRTIEEVV